MYRWTLPCLLPLVVMAWMVVADSPKPAGANTQQFVLNGHTFSLPAGFEIELVAGPPLVDRPITADFDENGYLYVADSSGSNEKTPVQLEKKPHRIVRLQSTKDDGKFDQATVFADKMMFPEGTMWYAGALYVGAPPSIWKLTDTDGDGVADERREWYQGKTLGGCANDLHGPYLGPDGWIYWTKGAWAKQTHERPGQQPFITRAAHIFRCWPDGTGIEAVMTGGMDNPVDVTFTAGGDRIFSTTFLQHPGGGRRDGLIHAIYGGIYGKDHDPIYEHPWTGPSVMPVLSHLGPAAPSGLHCYQARAFGPDYEGNLFAALFNMQKVTRHVLTPSGSTFTSRDEDFLVSSNRDFHPTDVIEDADGSLLVIDTGGWYKLCCPTSQLVKADVLGGIYRIRKQGAPKIADPRGKKLDWNGMTAEALARLLGDSRPAVRRRAKDALAARGKKALPALATLVKASAADERRNALWTLTRSADSAAHQLVRQALADEDETIRHIALHAIALHRDRAAQSALLPLLSAKSPRDRRAAAEALGRIGAKSAVPALLTALGEPTDRALEHSLIYALIEIADRDGTAAGLASQQVSIRRAALIALDQMENGKLDAPTVAKELTAADPAMKEAAAWIVGRHPEWGSALAGYFRTRLAASLTPAERDELARQIARQAPTTAIQELLVQQLGESTERRVLALRAMALAGLKQPPPAWVEALPAALMADNIEVIGSAVAAARSLPLAKQRPEKLVAALLQVASKSDLPTTTRLTALAAVPGGPGDLSDPLFAFVSTNLHAERAVADRSLAADVVARAKLSPAQLIMLAEAAKTTGPMELGRILEAFGQSTDDKAGLSLLAALKVAPNGVHVGTLRQRLAKYGASVQKEAEALYAVLDADTVKQRARLEQMLAKLAAGDVRRGQAVFNGTKAACSSCHAVGYLGGTVGPDLTRIGTIRQDRDLLESILFPSASFVQGFEPVVVATRDGKILNGLLRKNAPEEIVLVQGANQEVRIARDEVEDIQPSKVSVMPAGLEQQLTPQELADLVAFLKACK